MGIILSMQEEDLRWGKRFSQQFNTDRAQRQSYFPQQVHSQPAEDAPPPLHFHLRSLSKPLLPPFPPSPKQQSSQNKRLPPILRYLSQKFAKQAEGRREDEEPGLFKIQTHSLRKLLPFGTDRPQRKGDTNNRNRYPAQQEMIALKLRTRKDEAGAKQSKQQVKALIIGQTQSRGQLISGWHIQQCFQDGM